MELTIFDVGHGFCALLRCDNGNCILFDCGRDDETGFRPSTYLPAIGVRSLEELVITNFDADHVADLANLLQCVRVETLFRNGSISAAQLTGIKLNAGFLPAGMRAALKMHETYIEPIVNPPDLAGVQIRHFCNPYPRFTTTNDLSLVSFVLYDGIGIVFPGDLEKAGWEALLEVPDFRAWLNVVTIFIASHHGRESGYCAEVFDYCSPQIVILSDKEIQHETQRHCYDEHATGIQWTSNTSVSTRYVLTTRKDGHIRINKNLGSVYRVTSYGSQPPDFLGAAAAF